jgi:ribose-phosphate pyrophosphokinase
MDHLYAGPLIAEHLAEMGLVNGDTCVVSPDVGGVARARALAEMLGTSIAIIAKRRPEANKVEISRDHRRRAGQACVMIDDMIDTAAPSSRREALMSAGAAGYACCTHPVLSSGAVARIAASPIKQLVTTDTIPVPGQPVHRGARRIILLTGAIKIQLAVFIFPSGLPMELTQY